MMLRPYAPLLCGLLVVTAGCTSESRTAAKAGNQAPVADAGADRTVDERAAVVLDARGSRDEDGGVVGYAWQQVSGPTVALNGVTSPTAQFTAPAAVQELALGFRVTVTDNEGATGSDVVSIRVRPVNDAPVATPITATTTAGAPLSGTLPAADPDGDALTFSSTTPPQSGAVTVQPSGAFTYTPAAGFTGADAFGFQACDPSMLCSSAIATINVAATNTAPVAAPLALVAADGLPAEGQLLATDADGDTLSFSRVTAPASGAATVEPDGRVRYVPAAGFLGDDSFGFRACDLGGLCDDDVVTVRVVVNTAPVAADDSAQTAEETPVAIDLLANDTDAEDATLRPQDIVLGNAAHGVPALADGAVVFTPDRDFTGDATFVYTVKDSRGAVSNPATVTIAVRPAPLKAGVAAAALRVPVGTPLGGYLRPPVGGEYIPALEAFAAGDPGVFQSEFLDFLPYQADDGTPLAPVPDELRTLTSPYATFSPPTRGYYDSLIAKAIALHDGSDYVVLVKTDFIGMLDEVVQAVADKVLADTGIDLHDGLVMSATHSHDGPGALANHSTRYFWLAMDAYQPEVFERLVPQLAAVVEQALANLQPARFGHAIGQELEGADPDGAGPGAGTGRTLNSFRRNVGLDGFDNDCSDDGAGIQDLCNHGMRRRLGVLRIDKANGEPLAVVMNYAAHGIAFDVENLYYSGDVLAAAEREVEQGFDTPVLAMLVQNTGGNVSPRADGGPTLQRIERFGKLLAPQVRSLYDGIAEFQTAPDLRAVSQRVILSIESLGYAPEEFPYPWGASQCNNDIEVPFAGGGPNDIPGWSEAGGPQKIPGCLGSPPPDAADIADNGVAENGAFYPQDTRVTAVRIGDATLLAQPGEPLSEYGVRLLKAARDEGFDSRSTFIWGYSQDHVGYILADDKADWEQGGTEGTTTFWGWLQGKRLRESNVDLLRSLRDQAAAPADEFALDYFYQETLPFAPAQATPSVLPGRVIAQPASIERFQATSFTWEGGDPVVDLPHVTLEKLSGSTWEPARRPNGTIIDTFFEMHLKYRLQLPSHLWTVELEAPKDWPEGTYRFAVEGAAWQGSSAPYAVTSAAFDVRVSPTLAMSAPTANGANVEVTLAYTPRPDNYRLIDPLLGSNQPAPVRTGRVTFTQNGTAVTDDTPALQTRDGIPVAVFSVPLAGAISGVTARAVDVWGNTTPGGGATPPPPPPPPAEDTPAPGAVGASGQFFSDLGRGVLAALDGDFDAAQDYFFSAFENGAGNGEGVLIGEDASLLAALMNFGAQMEAFFTGLPDDPATGPEALDAATDALMRDLAAALGSSHVMQNENGACAPDNAVAASYSHFIGSLHEHSGYSDGTPGTEPRDYFAAGKTQGLDFVGASEHSDNAGLPITANADCVSELLPTCVIADNDNPADAFRKWDATLEQARTASGDSFTAFRGFEWTSDRFGHINVFFSRHDWNAKATEGYTTSMESFWRWLTMRPEVGGGGDGLAVFNHPGREETLENECSNFGDFEGDCEDAGFDGYTSDPAYTFDDFEYRPEADLRVVGVETFGKGGDAYDADNNAPAGGWYAYALDHGWHVGPVGAEDEHGTQWGKPARAKTVLIARDRSEGALREAMFARRFYSLAQSHNDLRLSFHAGGEPMGSRLARNGTVMLSGALTAGIHAGTLEIVTRGGEVVAQTTGRALNHAVTATPGERWYYLRVKDLTGRPVAYSAPIWIRDGGEYPLCGEWLAGDLHVHTTYSHDSYGGPDDNNTDPEEFYTFGHTVDRQFQIAGLRGLDYLAITDHNDIRSQKDPGFGAHGVIPVGGYEKSLAGHAQILGAHRCYTDAPNNNMCEGEKPALQDIADQVRADGGIFQINHPASASIDFPNDADWAQARGPVLDYTGDVIPDTVEVWNIAWYWQPPMPANNSIDDAVRYWEGWLDRGQRVAATGGSDNHWVATTAVQGAGQPTTWVFATERSEFGVTAALRAGRSTISQQPPLLAAPRVLLEADADGDGIYETGVGQSAPPGARMRVRVTNAAGAIVRILGTGGAVVEAPIPAVTPQFEYRFTAPAGATWLRADVVEPDAADERASVATVCDQLGVIGDSGFPEDTHTTYCRNRIAVLAMSSALFLR